MNELHLFAGIGGGILGGMLCGHRPVCAVELDPYCRSVLIRHQNDGSLPPFPIWDDIRTFNGERWRGVADVVCGGFPCQNVSTAGDRTGIYGEQSSLWFEMLRVVREVRPQYVFVENSASLVRNGLDVVLGGLVECGYDAEWLVLGADDVGAPHRRKRCWVLGKISNAEGEGLYSRRFRERVETQFAQSDDACAVLPNAGNDRFEQRDGQLSYVNSHDEGRLINAGGVSVDAVGKRRDFESDFRSMVDGFSTTLAGRLKDWDLKTGWKSEPVPRLDAHVKYRKHKLKAIGNAQVPLCAAVAFTVLLSRFSEED